MKDLYSEKIAKQEEMNIVTSEKDVCICNLGEEEHLSLQLPYDVDSHFYVFFCDDYAKVKVMLEQAGLDENGHYMNGLFLLEEDCLEKHISLSRVFEAM